MWRAIATANNGTCMELSKTRLFGTRKKRNKDVSFWVWLFRVRLLTRPLMQRVAPFSPRQGSSPGCVVADDFCVLMFNLYLYSDLWFVAIQRLSIFFRLNTRLRIFGYFFYYQFHFRIFWRKKKEPGYPRSFVLFQRLWCKWPEFSWMKRFEWNFLTCREGAS